MIFLERISKIYFFLISKNHWFFSNWNTRKFHLSDFFFRNFDSLFFFPEFCDFFWNFNSYKSDKPFTFSVCVHCDSWRFQIFTTWSADPVARMCPSSLNSITRIGAVCIVFHDLTSCGVSGWFRGIEYSLITWLLYAISKRLRFLSTAVHVMRSSSSESPIV